MGKFGKKNTSQKNSLMVICVVLGVVLALLIVIAVSLGQNKAPGTDETKGTMAGEMSGTDETKGTTAGETPRENELLVESITEQKDVVIVVTTYGTVKYPYAFSDLLSVEAETFDEYAVLEFSATIGDKVHKLYKLIFNGKEGMPIGTLQKNGETYVITAEFYEMNGVSDDGIITFNAAQETFNDVVNSLSENEGFTAAD